MGGPDIAEILTKLPFNHIFFTGSTKIGKKVLSACAENLTPCTLELGGKNPCIVDESANISVAARRICWGKFFNSGQTCVAPDYLIIHTTVKQPLIKALIAVLEKFYGKTPKESPNFGRIVDQNHTNRLIRLLHGGNLLYGGDSDVNQQYVGPTLIDKITWESPIMQEEIFGPILPILTYDKLEELVLTLSEQPTPLTVYFFSTNAAKKQDIARSLHTSSLVFNTAFTQLISNTLPFGGSGQSGMGRYRGKAGFDTFSQTVSLLSRHPRIDWPMVYPPYKTPLNKLKKVLKYFF
jgi:aldehyde dehydrogenase (NAD+)